MFTRFDHLGAREDLAHRQGFIVGVKFAVKYVEALTKSAFMDQRDKDASDLRGLSIALKEHAQHYLS